MACIVYIYWITPRGSVVDRAHHSYSKFPILAWRLRWTWIITNDDCSVGELYDIGHCVWHFVGRTYYELWRCPCLSSIFAVSARYAASGLGDSNESAVEQVDYTGVVAVWKYFLLGVYIPKYTRVTILNVFYSLRQGCSRQQTQCDSGQNKSFHICKNTK